MAGSASGVSLRSGSAHGARTGLRRLAPGIVWYWFWHRSRRKKTTHFPKHMSTYHWEREMTHSWNRCRSFGSPLSPHTVITEFYKVNDGSPPKLFIGCFGPFRSKHPPAPSLQTHMDAENDPVKNPVPLQASGCESPC